jgi:trk system potassium uptake protein TrkH
MFIGGAASMGGGITTGTFAVLVLAFVSVARGRASQAGDRTLSPALTRRALAVMLIGLGLILAASWLILLTHDLSFDTVLFEVISAFYARQAGLCDTKQILDNGQCKK